MVHERLCMLVYIWLEKRNYVQFFSFNMASLDLSMEEVFGKIWNDLTNLRNRPQSADAEVTF